MRASSFAWIRGLLLAACLVPGALAQTLSVFPKSLIFSLPRNTYQAAPQFLTITSTGGTPMASTVSGGNWLILSAISPYTLQVTVQAANLVPGTYTDGILVVAGSASMTVPVTLFIGDSTFGIVAAPTKLEFTAQVGSSPPPSQVVLLSVAAFSPTAFRVTVTGGNWLSVMPTSGYTPSALTVSVNHVGLGSGLYVALINVLDAIDVVVQVVQVTLTVTLTTAPLTASPGSLSFSAQAGSGGLLSHSLSVGSAIGTAITFTAAASTTSGGNWLSVSPGSSYTTTNLTVFANPAGLVAGAYQGSIVLSAYGGALTVPVTLTVTAASSVTVLPVALSFSAATGGPSPPPQSVYVSTLTGAPVGFTATVSGDDWLSLTPASAFTPATLSVSANPAGLSPGTYNALITVLPAGSATPLVVRVTLTVAGQVTLALSPRVLNLEAQVGDTTPLARTISVDSSLLGLAFTVTVSAGKWLSVTPVGGNTPATLTVSADPMGLAAGVYPGFLVISAPGAGNTPQTVDVTLTMRSAGPVIASIVHAATLRPGVLAAGTVVSIFGGALGPETGASLGLDPDGKVSRSLAGVRVLFDGIAAPLLYVHARQINTVAPYGLAGKSAAPVEVEYRGVRSPPVVIPLFEAAPGVFAADASGQGIGAILNQDNMPNSLARPAETGSIVSVFATGGGQTAPPTEDGMVAVQVLPKPLLPVTAWVGEQEAEVLYAGQAPGLVAGVMQVNLRIPAGARPGLVPLLLRMGRYSSQLGVTVAVR